MQLHRIFTALVLALLHTAANAVFKPANKVQLQAAVAACLKVSPVGDCSTTTHGPMGDWDVSAVTDMSALFIEATLFNADISKWNTAAVTNMKSMFYLAKAFNGDISKWNTAAVTNMKAMFYVAKAFNGDISKWNTAAVTDMSDMIAVAQSFNGDISKWNTAAVTDMSFMFEKAKTFNGDISKWNTAAVTDMEAMFYYAQSFNGDISKWNTAAVIRMTRMFNQAKAFNGDISKWDVSRVKQMRYMFSFAVSFRQTLCGAWLTSTADKCAMFYKSPGRIGACSSTTGITTTTTTTTATTTAATITPTTSTTRTPSTTVNTAGEFVMQAPSKACTSTTMLTSAEQCKSAKLAIDPSAGAITIEDFGAAPKGCSRQKGKWYFNTHTGTLNGESEPVCKRETAVAATTTAMKLKRFVIGKSTSARSHTEAHRQQSAFCKSKGGRLPTRTELCPNYDASKASAPALGCEKSESWVPVAGSSDNWMFIGCPGTGTFHHMCKDHVTHHGKPVWSTGDQFGVTVDCMVPTTATCEGVVTFCGSSKVDYTFDASYLKVGQTYRFDLFHAERHSPGSNFNFETTLDLKEDTCKDFLQQLKAGTYTSSKLHPGLLVTDETCPTERFEFADSKDSSYCDIRKCKPGYEPVGKNYLRLVCNGDMLRSYGKGFKCRKITSSTATKATIASTSSAPTAPSTTRSTTSRLRTSRKPSSTSRSDTGTTQPPTTKGPNTPSSGTTPPFPSIPGAKTTKPSEGTTTTASGALLKLSGVAAAVMIVSMI